MRVFSFHRAWGPFRSQQGPLLLALAFLVSLPPPGAWAQFPAELQGRVVDGATGQGLAGVRISVEGTPSGARTDGDGSFRIRGLEEGPLRLTIFATGFRPETRDVQVRNGQVTREVFVLRSRIVELDPVDVVVPAGRGIRLDREAVARSGARTVGELLEEVPGVVIRRRGPGGAEEASLRGSGSEGVLVLLDGVPLNDPMTGSADLSLLSVGAVRAVEVLPGAHGARYGPGALGGVIRIVTGGVPHGAEASLRAGSLGELGASTAVAGPVGSLDGEAVIQLRRLEGGFPFDRGEFLGGGGDHRRNADLREGSLHLALAGEAGSGRWQIRGAAEGLSRGTPGKVYAPSDSARQTRERGSLQLRWRGELGGGSVDLAAHHLRQDLRFRDPAPPLGLPFDSRARLRGTGVEAEILPRSVAPGGLVFGGGVSIRHQVLVSDQLRDDGRVRRLDGGAFVHGEWTGLPLPGGPGLSVTLRFYRDGGGGEWLPAHDVTLRLPLGPLRFHASHRSSFSPPSAGDQYFREGVGVAPNPDLRAERVPGEVEMGFALASIRGPFEGHVEGELFSGDLRDMIVWAPDFRFVWSPRNVDVRRRGGEVRGQLRHRPLALRVGGHLSRTDVTYVRSGEGPGVQVIYRPRDAGSLFLGWDPEPLRVEVRARYTGLRYPVAAPVNGLDPFWTLGAVVSGRWTLAGWAVRPLVRVDRLMDERDPFIYAFPEPGRTIHLEVRLIPGARSQHQP